MPAEINNRKECNCEWCTHLHPLIRKIDALLPEDLRKEFDDMIELLMNKSEEATYDLARLEGRQKGTWDNHSGGNGCNWKFGETPCELDRDHKGPQKTPHM